MKNLLLLFIMFFSISLCYSQRLIVSNIPKISYDTINVSRIDWREMSLDTPISIKFPSVEEELKCYAFYMIKNNVLCIRYTTLPNQSYETDSLDVLRQTLQFIRNEVVIE